MSRPKAAEVTRTEFKHVRLLSEEKTFVQEAADRDGLPFASWARHRVLKDAAEVLGHHHVAQPADRDGV